MTSGPETLLFADAEMIETMSQAGIETELPPPVSMSDARTSFSFTADSPYYTSYVEKEMRQVETLSETLKDISARAKTFGKYGALMAESTRRLSSACRLERQTPTTNTNGGSDDEGDEFKQKDEEERGIQERKQAVGEEMTSILTLLAEVLDEIASAQVQMCQTLEASLVVSLESFADTEMHQVSLLKADAESVTESAEASYSRYLNGRNAVNGAPMDSWNKLSEQVGSQIAPTLLKWKSGDMSTNTTPDRLGSTLKNWRSKNEDTTTRPRQRSSGSLHSTSFQVSTAANLQLTLEQIRLAQTSAELKRFQLLKKLVSIKKRRNFELGESALASLHGIRAYFNNCSDLVQGLAPRLNRIQTTQTSLRETHAANQAPWEQREQSLEKAMDQVGEAVREASHKVETLAQGGDVDMITQSVSLDEIEQETQIWQLPAMLAESSWYQRDPLPGVLVEGWLYKKSSSRMSLQQWSRRWFMMTKDGIYYFHSSAEIKKATTNGGYLHTLERVKICDTVLCMVRELQGEGLRFRFEIVTPNQRPLQLQARGPEEYKMWVEGIRMGAQNQLVHGDVSPDSLMQGLGKKKKKKGSGAEEKTLGSMVSGGEAQEENVPTSQFRDDEDEIVFKTPTSKDKQPMVQAILDANPVCADCGAPSPDWACINLGVLVCIECSGVHRSLGVHVSKVRSLRLDSLSDSEGRLLLSLGNDRVNPIWEAGLKNQRGWKKPTESDSRNVKEDWIKSKYQWKGFLEVDSSRNEAERMERFNYELYEAAGQGNVLGVADALAHGGCVEWKNTNSEGKTPLHACAVSSSPPDDDDDDDDEWQGIECAELLIQNGAKLNTLDDNHQSPLDCAVIGGAEREMIEFLSARAL